MVGRNEMSALRREHGKHPKVERKFQGEVEDTSSSSEAESESDTSDEEDSSESDEASLSSESESIVESDDEASDVGESEEDEMDSSDTDSLSTDSEESSASSSGEDDSDEEVIQDKDGHNESAVISTEMDKESLLDSSDSESSSSSGSSDSDSDLESETKSATDDVDGHGIRLGHLVLRKYQNRIVKESMWTNSLVVLPTGSGKTAIASAVICGRMSVASRLALFQYRPIRAAGIYLNDIENGAKVHRFKCLMLVPTVLLVKQQGEGLERETGARVAFFSGDRAVPVDRFEILVSTPEAYRRLAARQPETFGLATFNLVIFDEVHHVVKKHPYRKISRLISNLPEEKRPQILGLSASLTYAVQHEEMYKAIQDLCAVLNIENISTASVEELENDGYHGSIGVVPELHLSSIDENEDNDLEGSSQESWKIGTETLRLDEDRCGWRLPTDIEFGPHESREEFFHTVGNRTAHPLSLLLVDCVEKVEKAVKKEDSSFVSPLNAEGKAGKVKQWGVYAHSKAENSSSNKCKLLYSLLENLYEAVRIVVSSHQTDCDLGFIFLANTFPQGFLAKYKRDTNLNTIHRALEDMWAGYHQFCETYHIRKQGRLVRLKQSLEKQRGRFGESFRGIVFVQQRVVAHVVHWFLENDPDLREWVKSGVLYASSTPATASLRITKTQAREVVEHFRDGRTNLIVSTSVCEEGMDIPAANVVIRFDEIQTPVSLVQSRGRARQSDSAFVVLKEAAQKERSVSAMQIAEKVQHSLLTKNVNTWKACADAAETARERLLISQRSRLINAKSMLSKYAENGLIRDRPLQILQEYARKTSCEIDINFNQLSDRQWECIIEILSPDATFSQPRSSNKAQNIGESKKAAKTATAKYLLEQIIQSIEAQ